MLQLFFLLLFIVSNKNDFIFNFNEQLMELTTYERLMTPRPET
jgi:hypothetical protein